MAEVLFVSKPVSPPWNDSSKNLVRDLALSLRRHQPCVMGRRGEDPALPVGKVARVYPAQAGGFAPALADNARVLLRLLGGRRADVWHFFFAPNPKSSLAGRTAQSLRRVPTVHTVCSAPADGVDPRRVLFADRTVVLSHHTAHRLREAGVPGERLVRIPPAIAPLSPRTSEERRALRRELGLPEDAFLPIFPGDLEFGAGARLALEAFADLEDADAHLVMACRKKTARAHDAEAELRARADDLGIAPRTTWAGETRRIHELLSVCDVVLLPTDTLYAKMDYPLVVLEAMSLRVPAVVATGTPAAELVEGGGVLAVAPSRDAVGAALARLRGDDDERRALGEAAAAQVARDFDRDSMAGAYEDLYDSLL